MNHKSLRESKHIFESFIEDNKREIDIILHQNTMLTKDIEQLQAQKDTNEARALSYTREIEDWKRMIAELEQIDKDLSRNTT